MEINKIEDIKSEIEENINTLEKKASTKSIIKLGIKNKATPGGNIGSFRC